VLDNLQRYEEAIDSFDKALKLSWTTRKCGMVVAMRSYSDTQKQLNLAISVVQFKPDYQA